MSKTMRVFRDKEFARNFRIEGVTGDDILWKDFVRRGNPQKGVPAGGLATFAIKFNSPNAGNAVISQLEELYDVRTTLIVPHEEDQEPYKIIKVSARFDVAPPTIVLHKGDEDVVLSHRVQKARKEDRVDPITVAEFNENISQLQRVVIDHLNVDINVSKEGKPYISRMDVWQKLDDEGMPMFFEAKREFEPLTESEFDF